MTIDWYVLLAPLLLIPVVLLFVFVGCEYLAGIDEKYAPDQAEGGDPVPKIDTIVRVTYDASTAALMESFEVHVNVRDTAGNTAGTGEAIVEDIDETGDVVKVTMSVGQPLDAPLEGDITCTCTVTQKPKNGIKGVQAAVRTLPLTGFPYPDLTLFHSIQLPNNSPVFHIDRTKII